MTNKETYGKFVGTARKNSSQVAVPDDFTQSVMKRIAATGNAGGKRDIGHPAVILRWRVAAACISSAAAVLLLFGLFSVNSPRKSAAESSTRLASREMPVFTLEERNEIFRQTRAAADFIAELNK